MELTDADIEPLQYMTNLTVLNLGNNQISDISPLAGLTNLTLLQLGSNEITDISPLADLTNLTDLDLGGNKFTNIDPLAGLVNLTVLDLNGEFKRLNNYLAAGTWSMEFDGNITDISPLAGLTNLTSLDLVGHKVTDVSPLKGLTNLTSLNLRRNPIADWSFVESMNCTVDGMPSEWTWAEYDHGPFTLDSSLQVDSITVSKPDSDTNRSTVTLTGKHLGSGSAASYLYLLPYDKDGYSLEYKSVSLSGKAGEKFKAEDGLYMPKGTASIKFSLSRG
jgi:Leucine-rich repeat (LRR) protein